MIIHFLTIALRSLKRQQLAAVINIAGLSIGLACFIVFLLYAVNEFSYDKFHSEGANIYRVYDWWKFPGREGYAPSSITPLGPAMKEDLPDVEDFVRIRSSGEPLLRVGDDIHSAKVKHADPSILSVFTFPFLRGDSQTALSAPNNVVLTRSVAMKLFGDINVVGRQLDIRENADYESFVITGVLEDVPVNSSIRFEVLGSLERILNSPMGKASMDSWTMTIGVSVYVKLKSGSKLMDEPDRLATFRRKYLPNEGAELRKEGLWKGEGSIPAGFGLQPLAEVHTDTRIDSGATDPANIWTLLGIGAGVLLIACINFIVLAVGRSAVRFKEVGVRKVIGSRRSQLIGQFLCESLLMTMTSALLALGLVQIVLPFFNDLAGTQLAMAFDLYPKAPLFIALAVLLTGLVSGAFPAFALSGARPVEALKNKTTFAGANMITRSLVTLQFALSLGLIAATVIVLQQLSFLASKDLGFDKHGVVMVRAHNTDVYDRFREVLEGHSAISGVTASAIGLGAGEGQMGRAYDFRGEHKTIIEYPVDANFLSVMGMRLIAGRDFNSALTSDSTNSVIVNEALVALALMTTPENAIGMQIENTRSDRPPLTIVGVVENFHFEPLTGRVRPQMFMRPSVLTPSCFFVRVNSSNRGTLDVVRSAWKQVAPDLPFAYSFVDEKFDAFYKTEERWASILGWSGNISILIACLGLFGLAYLVTGQRVKEVCIRKVLGASVGSVVSLLCRDFLLLVVIAVVGATPITWYLLDEWLSDFAYRIEVSWVTFAAIGLVGLMVALMTVSFQVIRASMVDPARLLRSE